jgi:hypothetical protein
VKWESCFLQAATEAVDVGLVPDRGGEGISSKIYTLFDIKKRLNPFISDSGLPRSTLLENDSLRAAIRHLLLTNRNEKEIKHSCSPFVSCYGFW